MDELFESFSSSLRLQATGSLPLLDPDDSLLLRWAEHCDALLSSDDRLDPVHALQYSLERNTWRLLQDIYTFAVSLVGALTQQLTDGSRERLAPPTDPPPLTAFTPPASHIQGVIDSTPSLSLLAVLLSWLQSSPSPSSPAPAPPEIRRGYNTYTSLALAHAQRSLQPLSPNLVSSLDPDAPGRTGKSLEREDERYQVAVLRACFYYVRQGQLDLALDLLRQTDHSHLSAALSGGTLFSLPLLSPSPSSLEDVPDPSAEAEGNLRRSLWKRTCMVLARRAEGERYEKAVFGAVVGDVESVLEVCESWEDHLWCRTNALLEAHVDQLLASHPSFWVEELSEPEREREREDDDLGKVFERLLSTPGRVGGEAKNPFRVAQMFLVLDRHQELLESFVARLEAGTEGELDAETLSQLLRFFAHLVLVFRALGLPLPSTASERLLEAYVKVLEAHSQSEDLIASYCAHLEPSGAIEAYAQFLRSFGRDSTPDERKAALQTARTHGLAVPAIAVRVVELVVAPVPNEDGEERQMELIRTLEWLTSEPETRAEALRHSNSLMRFFLTSEKPEAARGLLARLPRDLVKHYPVHKDDAGAMDHQVREHLDYVAYFECLEAHSRVVEVWARRAGVSSDNKIDQLNYRDALAGLTRTFHSLAVTLLESEWLRLGPLPDGEEGREGELRRIRGMLVPHLVFALHHVLMETASVVPSNLQTALELASVVADERYRIYLEFVQEARNGIQDYLTLVREAALGLVDRFGTGKEMGEDEGVTAQ